MAKLINLGTVPGNDNFLINISAPVGANAGNLRQDVLVVQALLKYALEQNSAFAEVRFPEPTGGDVKTTTEIIRKFQRYHNRTSRQPVSTDGRISPIKGKSPFVPGTSQIWTIYALHAKALEVSYLSGHASPVEEICKRWSQVKTVLKNSVGSLGLALE